MGVKEYKPTSAGRRFMSGLTFDEVSKDRPEKSLLKPIKKTGGRNHSGKITTRHIGGGHKRRFRIIDFKRDKFEIPGKVAGVEYDPNRSANIALIHYIDGEKRYILAPLGVKAGDTVIASMKPDTEIKEGNALPLKFIPLGTFVHNIEMKPGKGGQLARSHQPLTVGRPVHDSGHQVGCWAGGQGREGFRTVHVASAYRSPAFPAYHVGILRGEPTRQRQRAPAPGQDRHADGCALNGPACTRRVKRSRRSDTGFSKPWNTNAETASTPSSQASTTQPTIGPNAPPQSLSAWIMSSISGKWHR